MTRPHDGNIAFTFLDKVKITGFQMGPQNKDKSDLRDLKVLQTWSTLEAVGLLAVSHAAIS